MRFVFAISLLASPAFAQPQCAPRDQVIAMLTDQYGETRQAAGLTGGAWMEVYAADSGTWTIIVTLPDGNTCMMASGEGYDPTVTPKGDPA